MKKLIRFAVAIIIAAGSIGLTTTQSEADTMTVSDPNAPIGYALYSGTGYMRCLYRDETKAQQVLDELLASGQNWYPELIPMPYDAEGALYTDDPNFVPTLPDNN